MKQDCTLFLNKQPHELIPLNKTGGVKTINIINEEIEHYTQPNSSYYLLLQNHTMEFLLLNLSEVPWPRL
jgi:hypothetical protein